MWWDGEKTPSVEVPIADFFGGGFGISRIDATGEVYGLNKPEDFAGAYGQAPYGAVIADASTGELWLENTEGVVVHLDAKRVGLALSLGVDGGIIDLQ